MRSIVLAVLALGAVACSRSTAGGGAAVDADDATVASFTGDWKVSGHIVAPWFVGPGFSPEPDADVLGATLALTETGSSGAATLTCDAATATVEVVPVTQLFEGKVTDAGLARSALGVSEDEIAVMRQTCTANGEALRLYHLIAEDRLLLGLNDIIYQFDREKAAAAPAP
mgnify:CR=1 FL=1